MNAVSTNAVSTNAVVANAIRARNTAIAANAGLIRKDPVLADCLDKADTIVKGLQKASVAFGDLERKAKGRNTPAGDVLAAIFRKSADLCRRACELNR